MADIWDIVPERFHYLRKPVELCGETHIAYYDPVLQRHISFTERMTKEQLECLVSAYEEMVRNNDALAIYEWCRAAQHGSEEEKGACWYIGGILGVMVRLGEQDVSPFCDAPLELEDATPMDEDPSLKLPEDLEYLVGPALHFGERYCDELRMLRFVKEASRSECDTLAALAERVRIKGDWPRILAWLNEVGTRHVRYCREIDNLFHLMDMCDLDFEPA